MAVTPHFRTYFSGDWDVHWGYGILTHGQMFTPYESTNQLINRGVLLPG